MTPFVCKLLKTTNWKQTVYGFQMYEFWCAIPHHHNCADFVVLLGIRDQRVRQWSNELVYIRTTTSIIIIGTIDINVREMICCCCDSIINGINET